MIIEVRTYRLKPGSIPEFEKRFGEALPERAKLSPLGALWHTEVGPLNEVTHVWPYESLDQRAEVRAEAIKRKIWPPNTSEFIETMRSEIYNPCPFSPKLEPRRIGPVFEIRNYTLAPGAIPGMMERWAAKVDERVKLSPLAGVWYSELGGLNSWVHIWAYRDAADRQRIRAEAVAKGLWPPGGAASGLVLKQENKIVLPAACSPLQ
jgi:hypothetical protein